jgi:hypothetical protein
MCRIMDTEYLVKQHEKIRQQFRHDAIMREIKKREDKLFKDMFIKIFLIITIFILLVYLIAK